MSNSHLDCQSLYQKVTQAFVDEILESDPLILRKIVRNIILGNIIQLRVSGQLAMVNAAKRDEWLIEYVRKVRGCYDSEKVKWLSYRDPQNAPLLYDDLSELVGFLGYRANLALADKVDDVIHEVFVQIRSAPDAYPYDCTLNDWIRSLLQQAMNSLTASDTLLHEDERFIIGKNSVLAIDFWEADTSRWDDILELRRWLSQQPLFHRRIFMTSFNGISAKEIAERFALTEGQVYRIVKKMREQLKTYWNGEPTD